MRISVSGTTLAIRIIAALSLTPRLCDSALAFVVDTTQDGSDANPGDGVCATVAAECTLRAAVEEANATPNLDFVQLADATYQRTIQAELEITDDVQIFDPAGIERLALESADVAARLLRDGTRSADLGRRSHRSRGGWLCAGGVGLASTRIVVRQRADGTTTIKLRSQLLFPTAVSPTLDPVTDGVQLRIEDLAAGGGALVERTGLTDPLVGAWRTSGARFRWRARPEPLVVTMKDRRVSDGVVDFKATTKALLPTVSGPIRATVVIGGDAAGVAGACAQQTFTCEAATSGTTLTCS